MSYNSPPRPVMLSVSATSSINLSLAPCTPTRLALFQLPEEILLLPIPGPLHMPFLYAVLPTNPPSFSEFTLTHSLVKAWYVQGSFSQNSCSDQVLLLCFFTESFFSSLYLLYIISMISTRQTFRIYFDIHVWQIIPSSPLHIQKNRVISLALYSLK